MAYLTTDYRLAAGNDNAGGLTAVTTITDGSYPFLEPLGLPLSSRGERVTQSNGVVTRLGYPRAVWISPLTMSQWVYLKDNYEGLVTVKLALNSITWANYNAVLTLQDPEEMPFTTFTGPELVGPGFSEARWTFTKLEAL